MKEQGRQTEKENKHEEKRLAEKANKIVKEQERKTAFFTKEKELERVSAQKHSERMEKLAADEVIQQAKDKERKKVLLIKEQGYADAEKARKLKGKN